MVLCNKFFHTSHALCSTDAVQPKYKYIQLFLVRITQHEEHFPCLYRSKFVYYMISPKSVLSVSSLSILVKTSPHNLSLLTEAQRYEMVSFSLLKDRSRNEKWQIKIKLEYNVVIFNERIWQTLACVGYKSCFVQEQIHVLTFHSQTPGQNKLAL